MADVVRDAVRTLLQDQRRVDRETLKRRSLDSLGRFRSGLPDLAPDHDRHLDEAPSA